MQKFGTVASVKAAVPDATFKRAREILTSSKLQNALFEGDLLEKGTALCQGSNPGDNYKVTISIDLDSGAPPSGHCTCPAALRALCKHSVALLLKRVEELTKLPQDGGGVSACEGENKVVQHGTTQPSSHKEEEHSGAVGEPNVVLSAEVLALSSIRRVLPAWMTKPKTEEEKPAKRVAAPKKPPPAPKPASKRTRGKSTKIEEEDEDDEDEVDEVVDEEEKPSPTSRRTRGRGAKHEEEGDTLEEAPKRARGRKAKHEEEEDIIEEAPKRTTRGRRKAREEEEDILEEAPKRATRGKRKVNLEDEDELWEDASNGLHQDDEVPRHRHRRLRKDNHQREEEGQVHPSSPVEKRGRKPRRVVEHDLSDEEAPQKAEEADGGVVHGLDLTSEDLLRFAHEHLDGDTGGEEDTKVSDQVAQPTQIPCQPTQKKKKSSIFSSSQWQNSLSQGHQSYKSHPVTEPTPTQKVDEKDEQTAFAGTQAVSDTGVTSENITGDLSQTFVPSLQGKTISASKPDTTWVSTRDSVVTADKPLPARISDEAYYNHDTSEVEAKPKKKSSLRDTVKLYL